MHESFTSLSAADRALSQNRGVTHGFYAVPIAGASVLEQ